MNQVVPSSALVDAARQVDWSGPVGRQLSDAADARARILIDGFVHEAGPPPSRFSWVTLGSHARRELHCASDQDHALFWETEAAASTTYAADLAAEVIGGLVKFGMRPCDGGYMADRWSYSVDQWQAILRERVEAPTPDAVVDADVFLDLRALTAGVDVGPAARTLAAGATSARLLHGLALAAISFPTPLLTFGRLPKGPVDLKKTGLAPIVLLARLYGLRARSTAVGTDERLAAAASAGVLSDELTQRLRDAYRLLTTTRLRHQLRQIDAREYVTDEVLVEDYDDDQQEALREAFRAIKTAQSVTSVTFRTDL
ncbi:MAG: putative nucleotidyltransferase substrate binding domain-containing protein [Candidatus Nanopelagicales bacterium]